MQSWPEGQYLQRIAPDEPERVTELLLHIPRTIENPIVWSTVVNTAKVLPIAQAIRLVPLIERALQHAPPVLFPQETIELIRILAEQKQRVVFRLSESLLWLSGPRESTNNVEIAPEAHRVFQRGRRETAWMLVRIEPYEFSEFCSNVLPALAALDAPTTISFLTRRLDRAVRLMQEGDEAQLRGTHDSQWWCDQLDHSHPDGDVRSIFAVALAGIARHTAAQGVEEARPVWRTIGPYSGDIFERIRYSILAHAGPLLQDQLDRAIGSDQILDPPFGGREIAALLRAQFANASHGSQLLFSYALQRGPSADKVRNIVEYRRNHQETAGSDSADGHTLATAEEISEIVADWQRRRLRWFHDQLPDVLRSLADRLAVVPKIPQPDQQAIDEVGFYSSDASWVGNRSPITADEIVMMERPALLAYLQTWRPDRNDWDGPSYRGLEEALTGLATLHPDRAIALIGQGLQSWIAPRYISAVFSGLRKALEAKHAMPWTDALSIALSALQAGEDTTPEAKTADTIQDDVSTDNSPPGMVVSDASQANATEDDRSGWQIVVSTASEFVLTGCQHNQIPDELGELVWQFATAAIRSSLTWADSWDSSKSGSFSEVLLAAYNTAGGDVTRMLLEIALWDYRRHAANRVETEPRIPEVEARFVPLVTQRFVVFDRKRNDRDTGSGDVLVTSR